MSQDTIKQLLAQLRAELAEADKQVDAETLELARRLDTDIDEFIENAEGKNSPLLEDAIALEARFAARHPVAERIIRELIDALGRMGI